ncbi:M15 family metallopeptidase [Nocardioides anomalus]|uniref:M15 family metallopeptidase n=1 Tax=Nocardioides anomalus TaxID=2712223 RepID=UPI001E432FE5|nr:M15 family metallopeptidase [Nocardioides anomalus]
MAKRALLTTVAVAALVLPAACSSDPGSSAGPTASTTGAAAPGSSADPAVAEDHAVPAPGPRGPGLLAPADILVVLPDSADADLLEQVEGVRGVTSVTTLALSEAVIENQAVRIAALDPADYRSFVPGSDSPDYQNAWARVAGGELALKPRLKDKFPPDAQGYLRLGGADDAPAVHIGAYVDQQPLVDAVVNQTWVKTLGMKPDNAMLIRTGGAAPQAVIERLTPLLGADAAITPVDKASRIGLDPGAQQVAVVTGTVADAVGVFRYTVLAGGRIAPDQGWVADHITTETVPILGQVTCNRLIFPQLKAALQEVIDRGLADKIHPGEYAGCYYPRFIAGTNTLSNHAFGLALDMNVPGNQRGTVGEMDRGVVDTFKKWGFAWGGDWNFTDPMHFEMAELVTPGGGGSPDVNARED